MYDEIMYPFLNFNGCTVEVLEWISNFILHFTAHVISYPWRDQIQIMLMKGAIHIFQVDYVTWCHYPSAIFLSQRLWLGA